MVESGSFEDRCAILVAQDGVLHDLVGRIAHVMLRNVLRSMLRSNILQYSYDEKIH